MYTMDIVWYFIWLFLQDFADTQMLLARDNVNQDALCNYAREAADFSTNHKLPHLDFAFNHYGQSDIAMFDFTSLFQAENASRVVERMGHKLLMCLVGDSLLEVGSKILKHVTLLIAWKSENLKNPDFQILL